MTYNRERELKVNLNFENLYIKLGILASSFETTHKVNGEEITVRRGADGRFISKEQSQQLEKDKKLIRNVIDRHKGGEKIEAILQDKKIDSTQLSKLKQKKIDIENVSNLEQTLDGSNPEREKMIKFLMEDYQFYKDNPKKQDMLLEAFDRGYNETPRLLQQSISASVDIGQILLEAHRKHEEALEGLKTIEDDNKFYQLLGRSAGYGADLSITAVFALGAPNVFALAKGRELQVFLMAGMQRRLIKKEIEVVKDTVVENPDLRIYSSIPFSFLIGSGLAGHFINAGEQKPELDKRDLKLLLKDAQFVMDEIDMDSVESEKDLEDQIINSVGKLESSRREKIIKMVGN